MEITNGHADAFGCEGEAYRMAYVEGFSKIDAQGIFDAGRIYDGEVRDSYAQTNTTPEDIARIGQRDAVLLTLALEERLSEQNLELVSEDEGTERWEKEDLLRRIFGQGACVPKTFSGYGPEMFERGFAHACYSLFCVGDFAVEGNLPFEAYELDSRESFAEGYLRGREAIEILLDEWDGGLESLDAARRRVVELTPWG